MFGYTPRPTLEQVAIGEDAKDEVSSIPDITWLDSDVLGCWEDVCQLIDSVTRHHLEDDEMELYSVAEMYYKAGHSSAAKAMALVVYGAEGAQEAMDEWAALYPAGGDHVC